MCAPMVLDELVDQKFLARQANGTYSRLADGAAGGVRIIGVAKSPMHRQLVGTEVRC